MSLGQRLKQMRTARRLSQSALAQAAGVHQPAISLLEAGKQQQVGSEDLRRLAQALGCTTDYLVGMHEAKHTEA